MLVSYSILIPNALSSFFSFCAHRLFHRGASLGGIASDPLWAGGGITARRDAVRRPFILFSFSILIPNALSSFFWPWSQSCREQVALPLLLLLPSLGAAAAAATTVGPLGDAPHQHWPVPAASRTDLDLDLEPNGVWSNSGRKSTSSASSSMSSSTSSSMSCSTCSLLLLLFLVFFYSFYLYFSATSTYSATIVLLLMLMSYQIMSLPLSLL